MPASCYDITGEQDILILIEENRNDIRNRILQRRYALFFVFCQYINPNLWPDKDIKNALSDSEFRTGRFAA